MRTRWLYVVVSLLASTVACDDFKKTIRSFGEPADPLVGTWRQIGDESGGSITFNSDKTYRMDFGRLDPAVGKDFASAMQVIGAVPGHYSRGEKSIVLSMDLKAVMKAIEAAKVPRRTTETPKGDTLDTLADYKLDGDLLEMTSEGKTSRYVRNR